MRKYFPYYLIFIFFLCFDIHSEHKQTISFHSTNIVNSDNCSLISSTVNETLSFIFSQVDSFVVVNDLDNAPDIDVITTVKQENNSFSITAHCMQNDSISKPLVIESNKFALLETFSEADNIGLNILNMLSRNNYSLHKLILNNELNQNEIDVYLDDKLVKKSDLNHILSGNYHLTIKQTLSSETITILDINPFIISNNQDTSLLLNFKSITNNRKQETVHDAYNSKECYSAFPDWNDDWVLSTNGKTIIKFKAKAIRDIFIGFATTKNQDSIKYQFDIGGWYNSKSVLRKYSKYYVRDVDTAVVLASNYTIINNNDYWIIFDKSNNTIAFGYGLDQSKNRVLFYKSKKSLSDIMYFSFSSWDEPVEYSDIVVSHE